MSHSESEYESYESSGSYSSSVYDRRLVTAPREPNQDSTYLNYIQRLPINNSPSYEPNQLEQIQRVTCQYLNWTMDNQYDWNNVPTLPSTTLSGKIRKFKLHNNNFYI